jgi:hypothetical protein
MEDIVRRPLFLRKAPLRICFCPEMWHLLHTMNALGLRRLLPILAILAWAGDSEAADLETYQSYTAKTVVAILGPKEGLTSIKYGAIQVLAQEIITSLLPAAERNAFQQMGLDANGDVSIKVNPVPDSLVFELHVTAPSSKTAADFANNVAAQLEQALPTADPTAIQQLERELRHGPILLLLEPAKPLCVTEVRR